MIPINEKLLPWFFELVIDTQKGVKIKEKDPEEDQKEEESVESPSNESD